MTCSSDSSLSGKAAQIVGIQAGTPVQHSGPEIQRGPISSARRRSCFEVARKSSGSVPPIESDTPHDDWIALGDRFQVRIGPRPCESMKFSEIDLKPIDRRLVLENVAKCTGRSPTPKPKVGHSEPAVAAIACVNSERPNSELRKSQPRHEQGTSFSRSCLNCIGEFESGVAYDFFLPELAPTALPSAFFSSSKPLASLFPALAPSAARRTRPCPCTRPRLASHRNRPWPLHSPL